MPRIAFVASAASPAPVRPGSLVRDGFEVEFLVTGVGGDGFLTDVIPDDGAYDAIVLWRAEWFDFTEAAARRFRVPVVAMVTDWTVVMPMLELAGAMCDLVLHCERRAVDHQRSLGPGRTGFMEFQVPFVPPAPAPVHDGRSIDVLQVGNSRYWVHARRQAAQRRLSLALGRRSRLAFFHTDARIDDARYVSLLDDAKLVLVRTISGEVVAHFYEAAQHGAVVLVEEGHPNLAASPFTPGVDVATYRPDDLVAVVEGLLRDEPQRRAMAASAYEAVCGRSLPSMALDVAARLEREGLLGAGRREARFDRLPRDERERLVARASSARLYRAPSAARHVFTPAPGDAVSARTANDFAWLSMVDESADPGEVERLLHGALEEEPSSLAASFNLAQLYYHAGAGLRSVRPDDDRPSLAARAIAWFDRCIELAAAGRSVDGLVYFAPSDVADRCAFDGRPDEPGDPSAPRGVQVIGYLAQVKRAVALTSLGRRDEAIAGLESARRAWPGRIHAEFHLARAYEHAGRWGEALDVAEALLASQDLAFDLWTETSALVVRCHLARARDAAERAQRSLDGFVNVPSEVRRKLDAGRAWADMTGRTARAPDGVAAPDAVEWWAPGGAWPAGRVEALRATGFHVREWARPDGPAGWSALRTEFVRSVTRLSGRLVVVVSEGLRAPSMDPGAVLAAYERISGGAGVVVGRGAAGGRGVALDAWAWSRRPGAVVAPSGHRVDAGFVMGPASSWIEVLDVVVPLLEEGTVSDASEAFALAANRFPELVAIDVDGAFQAGVA